jgi:hypothetical protein
MSARKGHSVASPVVRVAPLAELKVYTIYEHELEELASGSPASLDLNFALVLLPTSLSVLVTLLTTTIASDRQWLAFFAVMTIAFLAGVYLLWKWYRSHVSTTTLFNEIRNRLPPPEAVQEIVNPT